MIKCINHRSHTIGLKNKDIAMREYLALDELDLLALYMDWRIIKYMQGVKLMSFEEFKSYEGIMGLLPFNWYYWHFHHLIRNVHYKLEGFEIVMIKNEQ